MCASWSQEESPDHLNSMMRHNCSHHPPAQDVERRRKRREKALHSLTTKLIREDKYRQYPPNQMSKRAIYRGSPSTFSTFSFRFIIENRLGLSGPFDPMLAVRPLAPSIFGTGLVPALQDSRTRRMPMPSRRSRETSFSGLEDWMCCQICQSWSVHIAQTVRSRTSTSASPSS